MKNFKSFTNELREDSASALAHAVKAHKSQFRSDGIEPYVKHPERVAAYVMKFKKSHNLDALIAAAYLHDTVEDTDTTHDDLVKMFGGLVASLVKELTSNNAEIAKIGKTEYLAQKMVGMSSWALVIKLADRLDNVQDIATARNPKWRAKYKNQTLDIIKRLEKDRELSGTHKEIIKAIKEKLSEVE